METYEYKVVPAPEKATKVKGLRGPACFAHTLEQVMNDLGKDGWSYVRADTLPVEERTGLRARQTHYRNMLIFQRKITAEPAKLDAPQPAAAAPAPLPAPPPLPMIMMPANAPDIPERPAAE